MSTAQTINEALARRVKETPNLVAIRYARLGLWDVTTWAQLGARVANLASGMAARGVKEGSVVGIIAESHPDWIAVHHAALSLGAAVLAVDPRRSAHDLTMDLKFATPTMVIAGDEEQYDKTIETGAGVETIVLIKTRGMRFLDHEVDLGNNPVTTMDHLGDQPAQPGQPVAAMQVDVQRIALHRGGQRLNHETVLGDAQRLVNTLGLSTRDRTFVQRNFADPVEYLSSVIAPLLTGHETAIGSGAGAAVMFQEMAQARPTALHIDQEWLARLQGDIGRRSSGLRGLKKLAVMRGWKAQAPSSSPKRPAMSSTRLMSWVMFVAGVVFLGVSRRVADWWRVVGLLGILAAIGLIAVLAGVTVRDPLKRRYGLQRMRAAFAADGVLAAESVSALGGLAVPLVDVSSVIATQRTSSTSSTPPMPSTSSSVPQRRQP
jgi:long-chain acyl-CoA synthetase